MALENFPNHFTHTITTEVHADSDGRPWTVVINNIGGLTDEALAELAMEALNSWEGSSRPRWQLAHLQQEEPEDIKTFTVESMFG